MLIKVSISGRGPLQTTVYYPSLESAQDNLYSVDLPPHLLIIWLATLPTIATLPTSNPKTLFLPLSRWAHYASFDHLALLLSLIFCETPMHIAIN